MSAPRSDSKIALLDGDSWVYRCAAAAEKTYYLVEHDSPEVPAHSWRMKFDSYKEAKDHIKEAESFSWPSVLWSRKEVEPVENCLQMVKSSLENTLNVLGTSDYRLYISGRGNFRSELFPDYKANRETVAKPKYYRDVRDYLVRNWGAVVVNGMEADDAIGIDATELGQRSIVVGVDKDLNQIPGNHYDWVLGEQYTVSAKQGMTFFYEQLLSGDPTDNIKGLDGIGPVRAKKALLDARSPREMAQLAYDLYAEQLGHAPDATLDLNATLLWIKRKKSDSHPLWRHLGRERT